MAEYTHGGDVLTARSRYGGAVLDFSTNLNPLGMPAQAAQAARRGGMAPPIPTPCAVSCGRPSPSMTGWR